MSAETKEIRIKLRDDLRFINNDNLQAILDEGNKIERVEDDERLRRRILLDPEAITHCERLYLSRLER